MPGNKSITILHLSDMQFGAKHRFGVDVKTEDGKIETLLGRLIDDLKEMKEEFGLSPDLIVMTGDLAEWGMESEYNDFCTFVDGVLDFADLNRKRAAMVPGNHDINRALCEAYFLRCKGTGETKEEPYWDKWELFYKFFDEFYKEYSNITFTKDIPWTLFDIEDLKVVVAGLNSTMKESHRDDDHYGWCGENQYRWFSEELKKYEKKGWLRIGAVHHNVRHNVRRFATEDDANLRDEKDLKRYLADKFNLILHGHVHDADMDWLTNRCPILATGSAALKTEERPDEIPNQYQIIRIEKSRISRWCRAYSHKQKKWIGDNLPVQGGNDWKQEENVDFKNVSFTFGRGDKKRKEPDAAPLADPGMDDEIRYYCQKVEALHESMPPAGFATQVKVSVNIEDIHVPLHAMIDLTGVDEKDYADADQAEKYLKSRDMGLEISLLKAFQQTEKRGYKGIVILGDPGSEKTTHLKRVLLWCLRNGPETLGLPDNMLPVFLPLKELDDLDKGLDVFIQRQLSSPHLGTTERFGKRLLKKGNLLFLLDGLDEVASLSQREKVSPWTLGRERAQ